MSTARSRLQNRARPADTEQNAREALIAALARLEGLGPAGNVQASIACRWQRSGGDGLLITSMGAGHGAADSAVSWIPKGTQDRLTPAEMLPEASAGPGEPGIYALHGAAQALDPTTPCTLLLASRHAGALSCLRSIIAGGIPAFHATLTRFGGDHVDCVTDPALSKPLGPSNLLVPGVSLADALNGRNVCLIARYGMLVRAANADTAIDLAMAFEAISAMFCTVLAINDARAD